MHVSVTPLGSGARAAGGAARDIVNYLSGRSQQGGARKQEPIPGLQNDTGPGSYYADSAELPGRWIGAGAEALIDPEHRGQVDPVMLERVLLGRHPETGEQLVGARGSAGRTDREATALEMAAADDPDRLLTVNEVAAAAGVDASHLQRVLRRTEHLTRAAEAAGVEAELPSTFLRGTKVDRQWFITQAEAQRFVEHRSEPRVVLGYDLTFSVPKSVSVAWAASDEHGRSVIEAALHQAVDASLRYVEDHAIKVRVGGAQAKGDGMVAAAFLHDTSRELEPQLHVHVVVANMGTTKAGKVQALDGRGLFAHGTTAGHLAEAEIQSVLNQHGYRFTATEKGIAHLEQIPSETVDAFSTRRSQILDEVGALGVDSPAARQNAAYATRAAKVDGVDRDELESRWQRTLTDTGMTPEQLERATGHPAPLLWTPADTERLDRFLASGEGVTRAAGVFDRRDVIHTITDHTGGRLDADQVQSHADRWLDSDAVIPLRPTPGALRDDFIGGSGKVPLAPGTIHYTTPEVIATETAIVDAYRDGLDQGAGTVPQTTVEWAIAGWEHTTGLTLGEDQAAMVRAITTSGHQFQAVVGPAGSGKTAALEVAARAWEQAGYTVIGASVNGNAAEVLARSTGLETRTVASLLQRLRWDQTLSPRQAPARGLLSPNTVVIVDEASTLSNRDHAELIRHVSRAGATLRTVGDPTQHASVEAGGGWATIVERHPETTPKLTENRRMAGAAMTDVRLAAEDYRDHKISQALRRLEHGDRIVTAATSTELLDDLAVDWFVDWRRHLAAPDHVEPSRMLAENHTVRRDLNARAQVLLKEDGLIGVEGVKIGESTFHMGDQVIARQQDRDLRPVGGDRNSFVRNGTRGVVTAIDHGAGPAPRLVVDFDRRGLVTVPNEFLTKRLRPGVVGGLAPAYAMTTHAAQGDTYDTSRAVVTDRSSPEGTYVALTRGRHDLRLYAVSAQEFAAPNPAAEHGLPVSNDRRTLEDRIEARLSRPSPTQLATVADPDLTKLAHYRDIPVRRLEALDDPIAQRVARIKLGQAQRNTLRDLPADLVAVAGDERDSRAWRSAVARFAHYRERWQSDPLRSLPPNRAPAGQVEDHQRVTRAVADARAEQLHALTPRQIVDARRRLGAISGGPARDRRTVDQLEGRLVARRRLEARAVADANRQYRTAGSRVRGCVDTDAVERQRRILEQARHDLGRTDAALRDVRALTSGGRSPQATLRVDIERQALRQVVRQQARDAATHPQPYLVALVGTRPPKGHVDQWLSTARAVEGYRIGRLGLAPSDGPATTGPSPLVAAIGPRPSMPDARYWDRVQASVAALGRSPGRVVPGPTLGRS